MNVDRSSIRKPRLRVAVLCSGVLVLVALRCTTIPPPAGGDRITTPERVNAAADGERIHAATWTLDGSAILIASNTGPGCRLSSIDPLSGAMSSLRSLSFCPDRIVTLREGSLLLAGRSMSLWLDAAGGSIAGDSGQVIAAIDPRTWVSRDRGGLVWHLDGVPLRIDGALDRVVMLAGGSVLAGVRTDERGQTLVRVGRNGVFTSITGDTITTIDSFQVSPDGKEVVVSANGSGGSSDVALLSMDGGGPNWVVPERFDETTATWAPRGSKVSWIVHAAGGSVLRTVHVPTSAQLTVDFPWSDVRSIAWEPKAERMAVIASEPFASDRLEILRYGGEDRRTLIPAARRLEAVAIEPRPESGDGVYVTPPAVVRYDERSPVVIWLDERSDYSWKGGAAAIRATADCGFVFTRSGLGELDAAFWPGLQTLPWFDPDRVFIVSREEVTAADVARLDPRITVIGHPAEGVDAKSFIEVPEKADIDSFASAFLLDQLTRP